MQCCVGIDNVNAAGDTPLIVASQCAMKVNVDALLCAGADVCKAATSNGESALHTAARTGHHYNVALLLAGKCFLVFSCVLCFLILRGCSQVSAFARVSVYSLCYFAWCAHVCKAALSNDERALHTAARTGQHYNVALLLAGRLLSYLRLLWYIKCWFDLNTWRCCQTENRQCTTNPCACAN
jgi:ankyrin repeat protein